MKVSHQIKDSSCRACSALGKASLATTFLLRNIRSFGRFKRSLEFGIWLSGFGIFILCSCGYQSVSLYQGKSIAVPIFKNETYKPGIEVPVTNKIIEEFLRDGSLKVEKEDNADLLLSGKITNYTRRPTAFDPDNTDEVIQYSISIRFEVALKDLEKKEVTWKDEFSGKGFYYLKGTFQNTEEMALKEAIRKASKKIVERTIEGEW